MAMGLTIHPDDDAALAKLIEKYGAATLREVLRYRYGVAVTEGNTPVSPPEPDPQTPCICGHIRGQHWETGCDGECPCRKFVAATPVSSVTSLFCPTCKLELAANGACYECNPLPIAKPHGPMPPGVVCRDPQCGTCRNVEADGRARLILYSNVLPCCKYMGTPNCDCPVTDTARELGSR